MNFDKTKAMRNAERYLAQGKIRLAIGEYEQVVKNDPRDFGTLNMLGDLYTKTASKKEAVVCYTSVAEHYSKLGFAQKAIAVYNKISKIEPNSIEVSAKLAELYKSKGSFREARSHYVTLAEHFQKAGKKVEALAMWKQIAMLDKTNTDVLLNIARSYFDEGQPDEAVDAYVECGERFSAQKKHSQALACFEKSLEIHPEDQRALEGFVAEKTALGQATDAAVTLGKLYDEHPHNREILNLQIDCLMTAGNTAAAEAAVIRLVEQEPANYPKFLELSAIYLKSNDLDSASRILSMASEHMLVGGQASEFNALIRQVLAIDPDHLDALRLLVRYCAWQKDEAGFRDSLVKLAEIARQSGDVDDERYSLSQLTMIFPHETEYAERLKAINDEFGFENAETHVSLFDRRFLKAETPIHKNGQPDESGEYPPIGADFALGPESADESAGDEPTVESFYGMPDEAFDEPYDLDPAEGNRLEKEVDSIRFYIENSYLDLADKAINELRGEFGDRPEIADLRSYFETVASNGDDEAALAEYNEIVHRQEKRPPSAAQEVVVEQLESVEQQTDSARNFDLDELRNELGLEESESSADGDYETIYSTAVAYQEMGLVEQAIREFQDAVGLVSPDDGTRRFFQCANLLGHCFMQQGMPKLALKWFNRTLETAGLMDEEKQALWYEIAAAHELDGDLENAAKYFELVYAENVDFRDVRNRIRPLMAAR